MQDRRREAWVEIDLDNLKHNIGEIQRVVDDRSLISCIVKADAYGHGAIQVAKTLQEEGISSFGVATLDEAIQLRVADIEGDITVLGLVPDDDVNLILEYDLRPVVCNMDNVGLLSKCATNHGKSVSVFVAVDTGMGRIGFLADAPETVDKIINISKLPNVEIAGLFSHFATADEEDKSFAEEQLTRFSSLLEKLREAGLALTSQSFANSAALMGIPEAHLDIVRPGILLYGYFPSPTMDNSGLSLKPVMSVKAKIIHIKKVPQGFSCGYGRKFIAERESLIATLALGYADGYPRPYSSKAQVIVNGKLAPIAGNICMDQCMVDVTDVPDVKKGDEVIVLGSSNGSSGKELSISADDVAAATGTISYEILCAFGQRLPKVYK